jgi:hypothetical protein
MNGRDHGSNGRAATDAAHDQERLTGQRLSYSVGFTLPDGAEQLIAQA